MDSALRLMDRGLVQTSELVSGVYELREYKQAFSDENPLKSIFKICK